MNLTETKKIFLDFYNKGGISATLENVLAMLPSTILMPIIINSTTGLEIFNISNVLLASGICTIIFIIITKFYTPSYLGSSFAYIGVTCSICAACNSLPKNEVISYIFGSYLFSAFLLMLLSFLCKISEKKINNIIDFLIPPAVMGPAISLIGLELSDQTIERAGLTGGVIGQDAVFSLLIVVLFIIFSLFKRHKFRNASIFLSFIIVSALCIISRYWDISGITETAFITFPDVEIFILPKFNLPFLIMIIPPTMILFSEHVARKIMIENLKKGLNDTVPNSSLSRSVLANSICELASTVLKGVPFTLYAENIAVMRLISYSDIKQFIFAAILSIVLSFCGPFLYLIQNLPDPIIGGLSLTLMGVIAVPGLKMLIDRNVNYNKISNLLLTSAVLITGLSKIKINILNTEFSGMSLGLLIGIILNLFIKLTTVSGLNKETFSVDDICSIAEGFENTSKNTRCDGSFTTTGFYYINNDKHYSFLEILKSYNKLEIIVSAKDDDKSIFYTHYDSVPDENGRARINLDKITTKKRLTELIKNSYEIIKESSFDN